MNKWIVVTTINAPTAAIRSIAKLCRKGWSAVVVGDTKTPSDWNMDGIHFLSVDKQKGMFGPYADDIPYRHYSRKNLGYLYAMAQGADCILETDDDNIPYPSFGQTIARQVRGRSVEKAGWVNIYKYFTKANIWPRGLPLEEIHRKMETRLKMRSQDCPIQQYLADSDPDVDAIYRLIFKDPVNFHADNPPVVLSKGCWTPFNSQNTLFFRDAFPLLFLPCHVNFRMTDIWRSFVAQAALWVHDYQVAFRSSTVKQIRNVHDLAEDFKDEFIGYKENKRIGTLLEQACEQLSGSDKKNISATSLALWKSLAAAHIIPLDEIKLIETWFERVGVIMNGSVRLEKEPSL